MGVVLLTIGAAPAAATAQAQTPTSQTAAVAAIADTHPTGAAGLMSSLATEFSFTASQESIEPVGSELSAEILSHDATVSSFEDLFVNRAATEFLVDWSSIRTLKSYEIDGVYFTLLAIEGSIVASAQDSTTATISFTARCWAELESTTGPVAEIEVESLAVKPSTPAT